MMEEVEIKEENANDNDPEETRSLMLLPSSIPLLSSSISFICSYEAEEEEDVLA